MVISLQSVPCQDQVSHALNGGFAADILQKTLAGGPSFTSFLGTLWNLHGEYMVFTWGD